MSFPLHTLSYQICHYVVDIVDGWSNIYVGGNTEGTLQGQSSSGDIDAFICKYNSEGDVLWTSQIGTSGDDIGHDIAIDSSDDAYVTGYTSGSFPGHVNSEGIADAFIRKYDSDGNELWTSQFGPDCSIRPWGIDVDELG